MPPRRRCEGDPATSPRRCTAWMEDLDDTAEGMRREAARALADTPASILPGLRATTFQPGSNLRGEVAGAAWTFLLPSLELGRVVVFGKPGAASLRTLAGLASDVVCITTRTGAAAVERQAAAQGWRHVRAVAGGISSVGGERAPDVVVVAGRQPPEELGRLLSAVASAASPRTRVYVEATRATLDATLRSLAAIGLAPERTLRLRPMTGEIRSAVPLETAELAADLGRRGLDGPWLRFGHTGGRRIPRPCGFALEAAVVRGERLAGRVAAWLAPDRERVGLILAPLSREVGRRRGACRCPKHADWPDLAPGLPVRCGPRSRGRHRR